MSLNPKHAPKCFRSRLFFLALNKWLDNKGALHRWDLRKQYGRRYTLRVIASSQLPEYLAKFSQIHGVCAGRCVWHGFDWAKNWMDVITFERGVAHAHVDKKRDPFAGWICLEYPYLLLSKELMLHEVAHLITGEPDTPISHNQRWRDVLVSIGGTYNEFAANISARRAVSIADCSKDR
jgi:hypothetical protein